MFAQLLYGSKFHRVQQTRGQQGIGISAAGMYGLKTTGQPVRVVSKPQPKKPAFEVILKIDVERNCAEILEEREFTDTKDWFPDGTGVHIEIPMKAVHKKGRQSVDAYLEQTAIANPHAEIEWRAPVGGGLPVRTVERRTAPSHQRNRSTPPRRGAGRLGADVEEDPRKKIGWFFQQGIQPIQSIESQDGDRGSKVDAAKLGRQCRASCHCENARRNAGHQIHGAIDGLLGAH